MKIDGRCHCGFITFEAEAEAGDTRMCNCTDCQQLSGAAFRVSIRAKTGTFRLLSGEPTVYLKTADSGTVRGHGFCPKCGSAIYSTAMDDEPKTYSLRVGTLRQRDQLRPTVQIWSRSRQPWIDDIASIAKIERQP